MRGTKNKIFVDSNIVLYLLSADEAKAGRSEALLKLRPTISVQVLNEVTNVCARKLKMAWADIGQFLDVVKGLCDVVPLTAATHDHARLVAECHGISFYDACIVAAASIEGCQTLYTEDMHHGLVIEGRLMLRNPFADA
ncbi:MULTISPECIES: PIN domain-containing protein [Cupriavidus]|uniref:PIN domain-containing protein n=1 Tax=Cupriavidus TaxID=106589 RepID=UPI00036CE228|nr:MULTISPECIES: PIN domain-containing protein [Cupriavidus]